MHQTLLNWTTVIFFYKLEHATSILLSWPLNKKGHIKLPYTYLLNLIFYKLSYWVEVPLEGAEPWNFEDSEKKYIYNSRPGLKICFLLLN
jgi:nitrate reductase gamma subunit